jgi:hypothetical protein
MEALAFADRDYKLSPFAGIQSAGPAPDVFPKNNRD